MPAAWLAAVLVVAVHFHFHVEAAATLDPSQALKFLGAGYNSILGDPDGSDVDPGWRNNVLNATWVMGHPNWVRPADLCTYESEVTVINGGATAQSSMSKQWQVKGSIGLFSFASVTFTASNSVKTMNRSSWERSFHHFETRARCRLLWAQLPPNTLAYELDAYLVAAVKQLPTNFTPEAEESVLKDLVGPFGTHFASSVVSGGMMVLRSSMTDESFQSYSQNSQQSGWSMSAGAQGHFWIFADPNLSGGEEINKEATAAFKTAIASGSTLEIYQGGAPFRGQGQGGVAQWAAGLASAMVPIGSDANVMLPISSVLNTVNFPPDVEPAIDQKRAVVERTLARICQRVPGCTERPVDPPPPFPPQTLREGSAVLAIAWSPNGTNLASGSDDGFVRVWDVLTGSNVRNLDMQTQRVYRVAYFPDGERLVSNSCCVGGDNNITVWDVEHRSWGLPVQGHGCWFCLAIHPDGSRLAACGEDRVAILDLATGTILQELKLKADAGDIAFSPDGTRLAAACQDSTVRTWDVATGAALQTLKGHTSYVNAVSYSPDGKYLASGSSDFTVRIWDAVTGTTLLTLQGHIALITSVSYSPDGRHLASGSYDGTLRVWDTATGASLQTLRGHTGWVQVVAYSPDGKHLASCSSDKTIRIWDAPTGAMMQLLV